MWKPPLKLILNIVHVCAPSTNVTPQLFIEVPQPSHQKETSYVFVCTGNRVLVLRFSYQILNRLVLFVFPFIIIVHIRMCQRNLNNGCDKKATGFICQCSTDFCNKDLMTCHKDSGCTQSLNTKPQNHQLLNVNLMASKETEFHGINR